MTITDTSRPPAASAAGFAPGQLFIDGEWREASTGDRREVINPSNGEVITSVAWAGPDDVDAAADGRLPLDRLEKHYTLDEIQMAAEDMHHGVTVKPVIVYA